MPPGRDWIWPMEPWRISDGIHVAGTLARAGMLRPIPSGSRDAGDPRLAALRPHHGRRRYRGRRRAFRPRAAIIDDDGTQTFAELERRTNALAHGLAGHGVKPGASVALLCRNHRCFVEATIACSKLGANVLYLNTGFAGPQLAEVVRARGRRPPSSTTTSSRGARRPRPAVSRGLPSLAEQGDDRYERRASATAMDDARGPDRQAPAASRCRRPSRPGRTVILTSGTTGTPKGASRRQPGLDGPGGRRCSRGSRCTRARPR